MRQTDINAVAERMTPAALLEQLAEEAIELAHAAGKYARLIRGESPTNITPEEAHRRVKEEMSDVFLVARVVKAKGFDFDSQQMAFFFGSWFGFVLYAVIASGGHDDER